MTNELKMTKGGKETIATFTNGKILITRDKQDLGIYICQASNKGTQAKGIPGVLLPAKSGNPMFGLNANEFNQLIELQNSEIKRVSTINNQIAHESRLRADDPYNTRDYDYTGKL